MHSLIFMEGDPKHIAPTIGESMRIYKWQWIGSEIHWDFIQGWVKIQRLAKEIVQCRSSNKVLMSSVKWKHCFFLFITRIVFLKFLYISKITWKLSILFPTMKWLTSNYGYILYQETFTVISPQWDSTCLSLQGQIRLFNQSMLSFPLNV